MNSNVARYVTIAFLSLAVLGACTIASIRPASAQTVPVTSQASIVRAHLVAAVDVAMPAVHCADPRIPASVLSLGGDTRIVACGVMPGFDAALIAGLGTTLAELGASRPRAETLATAELFAAYLESLVASRRPVEMTFSDERVVATRR